MYQKTRLDNIMEILNLQGYVTTKQLIAELHYSSATINRDLNLLEKQGLLKRTYGGAEKILQEAIPLIYRYDKMRVEKRRLAKTAAGLVEPGDTIFIDSTTTTQIMGEYLVGIKDLRVITNNMALATFLAQHGVRVICLGGAVFEIPHMLFNEITVINAMHYHADKMFFSTGGVTSEGKIWDSEYMLMHQVMAQNSSEVFYLVDHAKLDHSVKQYLFTFDQVDCVISDFSFSPEVQERFAKTKFVLVES